MAVSKKITRKVIAARPAQVERKEVEVPNRDIKAAERKRGCSFCQNKSAPTFTDIATLKRYVSDRGKIIPRARSGACSKHQRQITRAIKHARHLSLLPFTPKV